jgi:hypothetical protein
MSHQSKYTYFSLMLCIDSNKIILKLINFTSNNRYATGKSNFTVILKEICTTQIVQL